MRKWFSVWRREVEITMRTEDLLDSFPVDPVIGDDDVYRFNATQRGRLFDTKYEWHAEPDNGAFHLVEHAYISRLWYFMVVVSLLGICMGYLGTQALQGVLALIVFFMTFVLLMLFVGVFIVFLQLESPVIDVFRRGRNHTQLMPIASLSLTAFPLLLVVIAGEGYSRILGFLGMLASLTVYGVFHSWVVDQSFRWQRWVESRMKRFPLIAANYVTSLGLSSVLLIIFLTTHDTPLFLRFSSRWPVLFPLIYAVIVFLLLGLFGRSLFSAWQLETRRFRDKGRNINNTEAIIVTTGVVIAASLGFGYLSYLFIVNAVGFLTVQSSVGAYSYVLLSGIPVLYFATGLVYQGYRFFSGVTYLLRRAERCDLSHILDVEAETYVLNHDGIYAGAISLYTDYIVVSQGILDQLPEEQVAVILAHEEGHLQARDTVLGLLLTILSPLVLTGKNVLYGVLDFRGREFQADQYAASRLDNREHVYDTLDGLQLLKAEDASEDVPSITPTLLSLDKDNDEQNPILARFFGFYFGEFAMSQVHPTLAERKTKIRKYT